MKPYTAVATITVEYQVQAANEQDAKAEAMVLAKHGVRPSCSLGIQVEVTESK